MAITALPHPTVLLLGSAQALTTPLSLVKELIDNALDAKARAVEVLISQNTLDKIEVRDNGHGIQCSDLDALGRRCYTSKLTTFDELRSIGGTSLGFRGEALASAVQLGDVSITTKTDGETVATCVKLKSVGGIASQARVAHPVGTTVCVQKFCFNIPVRKQTALKAASKTLTQLKELLQTYALARPAIRFSLKIAKSSKGSWSYSPRPGDGIREAITQLMGREAAGECLEKSLAFSDPAFTEAVLPSCQRTESISESAGPIIQLKGKQFVIDLFLPKPHADIARIGHGQFVSIDSRPVSHEKGTMRKIIALFKSYFKASLEDPSEKIKNPFLRLNINCPIGSYDPNVEPAKDNVLFENESFLLGRLENFLQEIYGKLKPAPVLPAQNALNNRVHDFEMLLSQRSQNPDTERSNSKQDSETNSKSRHHDSIQVSPRKPYPMQSTAADSHGTERVVEYESILLQLKGQTNKWGSNMSKDFSEEAESSRIIHEDEEIQPPRRDYESNDELSTHAGSDLNPWAIAEMNAPAWSEENSHRIRAQTVQKQSQQSDGHVEEIQLRIDHRSPETAQRRLSGTINTKALINPTVLSHSPHDAPGPGHPGQKTHIKLATIDNNEELFVGDDASQFARRNHFISAGNVGNTPIPTPPPTQRQIRSSKTSCLMKPYVSPLNGLDKSAPQEKVHQSKLRITRRLSHRDGENDINTVQQESNPDLEWAMDYELKKGEALRRQRQEFQAAQRQSRTQVAISGANADIVTSSPHSNRFMATVANLEEKHTSKNPDQMISERFKTTLPGNDPRAYLMRRQEAESMQLLESGASSRLHRAKPTRLPFESFPDGEQLQNLLLSIPTNMESFRRLSSELTQDDVYVQNGVIARGITFESSDKLELIGRIKSVAGGWSESKAGGTYEYDFRNLLTFAN